MSNENAKIDDNYKKSLTAVSDDALREIKKLLVDPITGRLKVQITGANKSKKQEVYNETGGTLSQNRFVKVVSDNNLYLIPNVDYISSLNDIPVGFLTVDFLNGSRAEPLIRGRVEIAGFDTSTANIGDPVYSDENGNPTLFPTGLEVGQVLTPATDGVVFINLGAKTDIVEKMTTATDPAIDAAVTQTIVDNFIGVIITLTTTGNSQTIANPTLTSKIGKKFTVVNNDTSTNSIVVNGQTIEIGEATTFIWDGSAWVYVDINENLFEIAGSVIRPITDGNDLDMRTGTITTPTLCADTILEKTLNSGVTIDGVLIKDGAIAKTVVGLGNVDNIQQMPLSYLDTDGNLTANSDVKVSSQKAIKTYVDSAVAGLWDYRGSYDASGNTYPTTGGSGTSGAILKGDLWVISVAGTLGGKAIQVGDFIIAKIDTPEQTSTNWDSLNTNLTYVPEDVANKVISISALSTDTEYASAKCIFDELALKQDTLSKATGSDIDTGTDDDKYVTPKAIADSKLSFTDGVETLTNKTLTNPIFTNGTINFNAPQGFLINGKIVRTVDGSGNMTVALKGLDGNDPSTTNPIYIRIGNTVRAITSALSVTCAAGFSYMNLGSAELATKEVSLFTYLVYSTTLNAVSIGFSRIPSARLISDMVINNDLNEKAFCTVATKPNATDEVELIGRFNATLSAGAGYTWSIPATNIIMNRPENESEFHTWNLTLSGGDTTPTFAINNNRYKIIGNRCIGNITLNNTSGGTQGVGIQDLILHLPFSAVASNYSNDGIGYVLVNAISRPIGLTYRSDYSYDCFVLNDIGRGTIVTGYFNSDDRGIYINFDYEI